MKLIATEDILLDKGLYLLAVQAIEVKQSKLAEADGTVADSTYLRWTFDVLEEGFEGNLLRQNSSTSFGPSAKGRQWAEALLGRTLQLNEPVETDDLVGLKAMGAVGLEKKGDKTYNKIDALSPIRRKQPQAQAQRPQKDVQADVQDLISRNERRARPAPTEDDEDIPFN